jgi:hypothetical protein
MNELTRSEELCILITAKQEELRLITVKLQIQIEKLVAELKELS